MIIGDRYFFLITGGGSSFKYYSFILVCIVTFIPSAGTTELRPDCTKLESTDALTITTLFLVLKQDLLTTRKEALDAPLVTLSA